MNHLKHYIISFVAFTMYIGLNAQNTIEPEASCYLITTSSSEMVKFLMLNEDFVCYRILDTNIYHQENFKDSNLLKLPYFNKHLFGKSGYFLNIHSVEFVKSDEKFVYAFKLKVSSLEPGDYNYFLRIESTLYNLDEVLQYGKILNIDFTGNDL